MEQQKGYTGRKLTKDDLARVTGRLLADLSRAGMIAGCCTQGCCDDSVLALISNPQP